MLRKCKFASKIEVLDWLTNLHSCTAEKNQSGEKGGNRHEKK